MELTLSTLDICEVFVYIAIMLAIGGWCFLTNNNSADEFMDGGRSLGHWPLGISVFATWMSNMAIISLPAIVYGTNWSYFLMFLGIPITAIFVVRILLPIYRNEGSISAYSYLGTRFGSWAPVYCVICYSLNNLLRLGIIMYLMATAIGYLSGYAEQSIILTIGAVVIIYTFMGGFKCVVFTDIIQATLFFSGTVFILFFIIHSLPCTFTEAISFANKHEKFSFGSSDISFLKPTIWILAFNSLLFNFEGLGTEQGFVQRYIAAKNKDSARKSVIIGSLLIFLFSIVLFTIGTLLFAHYHYDLGVIGQKIDDEYIILKYIGEHIPFGLKGIVIITIMAAAMSSIDSELNGIATIYYKHIHKKIFANNQEEPNPISILYKSSIIIGIIPIIISFFLIEKSNLFDMWSNFDSVFSGSILGLFMLALCIKKSKKNAALTALFASFLVIASLALSQIGFIFQNPIHPIYGVFLLLFIMLISGFLAHLLIQLKKKLRFNPINLNEQ